MEEYAHYLEAIKGEEGGFRRRALSGERPYAVQTASVNMGRLLKIIQAVCPLGALPPNHRDLYKWLIVTSIMQ
jgi:hypothetical protein